MSSPPAPRPTAPIGSPCIAPGCSSASLAECRGCRSAVYCGSACATAHWPAHAGDCGRWAAELSAAAAAAAAARDAHDTAMVCAAADCDKRSIARCTRCRRAGYCGTRCQHAHWPAHKAQCRAWAAEAGAAGVMVVHGGEAARAARLG